MAATTTSTKTTSKLDLLIAKLANDYPQFKFEPAEREYWSARAKTIFYNPKKPSHAMVGVLHELSHALLGHTNYGNDFELLQMEAQAWAKSVELGSKYGVNISDKQVQDCLDTYRYWLFKRSLCPDCSSQGLQTNSQQYRCPNCQKKWSVTSSRFRRPYRLSKKNTPKNPA